MALLTDFIPEASLQNLQDSFSELVGVSVRVCDPAGRPITARTPAVPDGDQAPCEAAVLVEHEVAARVVASPSSATPGGAAWLTQALQILAGIIGRLCDSERQLRTRVDELATLYHVTAEFTGQSDLQSVLDRAAAAVVQVLKAKACSIRLLNDDRTELVFKAVANLSSAYLNKGPILVSASKIDQEAIETSKPVYIADEGTDPRVLYSADARSEGIVSALVAPMIFMGQVEGIIRVYTAEVHEFDWFEVSLLESIAAQAAAAIVNARLHGEAVRAADMQRQIRMAGEVQRRMIPSEPPKLPGLDLAAVYVPCFELGGDFYDFIDLPPDNIGLAVCDVVGKGVRASLLMASIRASLRAHAHNVYAMSKVLEQVNHDLCSDTLLSDFATLFYGVLDYRQRRFTYANAGHIPPLLVRNGQSCHLSTGGGVIGIEPDVHYGYDSFLLRSGDVVLAYTDGLMEAMNFQDEPFGRERTEAATLAAIRDGKTADGIVKHLLWEMRRFTGLQTASDDLTIIAVRVL